MRRRELLKAAEAATLTGSVAPRLGHGADRAKTLVFVGVADLSVLDPVITGARPTRNYAYLVFDTLYGIDTEWKARPQMVEGHTVEEDGPQPPLLLPASPASILACLVPASPA
jgi:peptide/nickel transport system substrate-binding protein